MEDVDGAWLSGDGGDAAVDVLFGAGDATRSNAGPSTPVMSASTFLDADMQPRKMYISRNYRLLPVEEQGKEQAKSAFQGRIYLQGVEEATHGLSDSLLSVLGVRAGEVVGDMYA